ncbi:MAG: IclR family transcriptional regulator [Actinomycetia bacterium]|nr:IclR family transcriptional regulator [Actinomycetes bacterium]
MAVQEVPRSVHPLAPLPTPRAAASRVRPEPVDGGLKSVTTALDLLDCFAHDEELGVSDLARRLGVAKSTAHRLLSTLCARGLTEQNPETGQYRLGLHLFELGQLSQNRIRLRRTALPLLEELREVSGWTIHLAIADGADVVYLERLETLRCMQLLAQASRRWPAHSTASGKAIAAFDPAVEQARRGAGFPWWTQNTIRSERAFDKALAETRRQGVAISQGEARLGLTSVAAPVRDATGRARAAISVVGPAEDMAHDLNRPARLVTVAARRLARSLAI